MESIDCSVCHQPFPAAEIKRIGARDFCAPHYARATRMVHTRLSRSGLIEVAVAGAFVGAVWIGFGGSGSGTLPTSVGMGLLLALVPALIWATYVMRQDRIAPEPWGYVLGVFLLGGLLAHAVVQPLANGVFHVDQWGRRSAVAELVAGVGVVATLKEFCKYLAVRYTVYLSDEFDEPIDGVVYATAAGLGVATVTNVALVVENHGVLPLAGATVIVTTTLVQVASSTILGYGLSRARFARNRAQGQAWLAACFVLAVVVDGALTYAARAIGMSGTTFRPWVSLSAALGVTVVTLLVSQWLSAKLRWAAIEEASHGV